jgi:hypothetical protein
LLIWDEDLGIQDGDLPIWDEDLGIQDGDLLIWDEDLGIVKNDNDNDHDSDHESTDVAGRRERTPSARMTKWPRGTGTSPSPGGSGEKSS